MILGESVVTFGLVWRCCPVCACAACWSTSTSRLPGFKSPTSISTITNRARRWQWHIDVWRPHAATTIQTRPGKREPNKLAVRLCKIFCFQSTDICLVSTNSGDKFQLQQEIVTFRFIARREFVIGRSLERVFQNCFTMFRMFRRS